LPAAARGEHLQLRGRAGADDPWVAGRRGRARRAQPAHRGRPEGDGDREGGRIAERGSTVPLVHRPAAVLRPPALHRVPGGPAARLTVGHLVLCDAFRHPAVLAREVVTLDNASGGRFELGIGSGSVPAELTRFGVEVEGRRVDRLGETLEVLKLLWSGEPVDY